MKIAIMGGGPVGVEAALYASVAGLDVHLFERGRLGENARRWGHVRMFTEWARNRSPLAQQLLRARGDALAPLDSHPTGNELANNLQRLAGLPELHGRIFPQTSVVSLTRDGFSKSDYFGDARRSERPFRVLTKGVGGERVRFFDAVLDCTGVYSSPNHLGKGGAVCVGETALKRFIDFALPDVLGRDRDRFFNHSNLVVGSGHSAAQTLLAISSFLDKSSKTRLTWCVRRDRASDGAIYRLDPDDTSSARRELGERANRLAREGRIQVKLQTQIEAVQRRAGRFKVQFSDGSEGDYDTICAHTGFRPDAELWEELQVAVHPATGGPARLAEAVWLANQRAGVGISTGYGEKSEEIQKPETAADGRELLKLDEPNFYVLGVKSYGRDAGFLIHNGFRQIRDVFQLISKDYTLDLYGI